MIGKGMNGRIWAIRSYGEEDWFFRRGLETGVVDCRRSSYRHPWWAVASKRVEKRNPQHPAFLTDETGRDIDPADSEQLFLPGFWFDLFFCYRFAGSKIRTASCDVVFASSVCQQAEVTNPHKTFGQYVKQEPSDKFICLERHGLLAVIVGIIPPEKRDMAIPVGKDAVVTDGNPVGISAEVLKDTFGAIEGRLAVDHTLLSTTGRAYDYSLTWLRGNGGTPVP